ncbi:hypothetical protein LJC71_10365, partial [Desulfosarcina sp. OttesenSCG-928-A07]|nr:hypothetical protein [Desulfosarcina sp. OttesenSCG-928-A07]
MGPHDIAFDREMLEKELSTLSRKQRCWFAARCALRVLSILAVPQKGVSRSDIFYFWEEQKRAIHLFNLFRAINAAYADAYADDDAYAAYADDDAYAAYADDDAYVAYVDATAAAAKAAARAATATATADAATAAAYAATIAADFGVGDILHKTYSADLAIVRGTSSLPEWPDLWQGEKLPDKWDQLEQTFIEGLRNLGLDYWAETYAEWRMGKFDTAKLERCLFMPESVINTGVEAMLDYLRAEKLVAMDEARVMFLGEGGAGKTSLINCLDGKPICPNEPATPRVAIRQRLENIQGKEVRVHYWDFGGQVVMHATHQFFLREKAIYVVVLDIRRS